MAIKDKILRIEINGTTFEKNKASDTYIEVFNFMYKNGLIKESILADFPMIVKENASGFPDSSKKSAKKIKDSNNLWIATLSNNDKKIKDIKSIFNRYGVNGTIEAVPLKNSPSTIKYKNSDLKSDIIAPTHTNEITNTEKAVDIEEPKAAIIKLAINDFKQAICILGDSGVGKSERIKRTLENAGHEKLIVIIDSLWSHLLFDYIPESRKYELTKIGEFIKRASGDATRHYTIVIDECHKNIEIINDSLLQAISTNRNGGFRFLSLNTFGDKLFDFLPHENGNRLLPDNLGFVFISSKRDVIIEGNPDLKNRVEIIELTKDDWQDTSHDIQYLLAKIKKEEPGEYTN